MIFFNNVDYLGMCGHGTIGLVVTLAHLGRITVGVHRIETPVGVVTAELHADGRSLGDQRDELSPRAPGFGRRSRSRRGAWVTWPGAATGSSWCTTTAGTLDAARIPELTDLAWRIRQAINRAGRPRSRPCRTVRAAHRPAGPFAQFRVMSGRRVRSVAVRNGHQRQAGLPGRGRQVSGE